MNIKITYGWLRDYLETDASVYEIQKYLSLCGPSVERVEKLGDDYVMDIEITSNRIDSASVLGIAQECQAILPMFGKTARLKLNPLTHYRLGQTTTKNKSLTVQAPAELCSRFCAVVIDRVSIKPSPTLIQRRLTSCGIKAINNVVDISNYLMLALGQPVHTFDYDKIGGTTMQLRLSHPGEQITTLDGKTIELPGDDIVIEDGQGKLIDLCGIMGALNSAISPSTKRVLLFVQTYNKNKIRRTSMLTGQRTVAATFFEKGLDEERVGPTMAYGMELFKKNAFGQPSSPIIDIYPKTYQPVRITIAPPDFDRIIGVSLKPKLIEQILTRLGFAVKFAMNQFTVTVPSWRQYDVAIKEDVVEEVARVNGYFNLPNVLQPIALVKRDPEMERLFVYQNQIKIFLKHLGLNEVINYSMVSAAQIGKLNLDLTDHLELNNTVSEEIKYLRTTLAPSLAKNIEENTGKYQTLRLFEIGKTYVRRSRGLPNEHYRLGIAVNTDYFDLKGMIEALFTELNLTKISYGPTKLVFLNQNCRMEINLGKQAVGFIGQIGRSAVFVAELDFEKLTESASILPIYQPVNQYAEIKLDWTVSLTPSRSYQSLVDAVQAHSRWLNRVELISLYRDKATLRLYFSASDRNLTEKEAKQELETIKTATESL
ncbi:phenylalanine--tRNA ligase subunit beta [Patescibacteria group bacterium]|nr:phenylalanine--tRNA ligase subunit beta [Patescibacteria group bacterium]MCL5091876.1 phenylalanine--tRNA ligase subunit beta [Patescibacteria group bacterium]